MYLRPGHRRTRIELEILFVIEGKVGTQPRAIVMLACGIAGECFASVLRQIDAARMYETWEYERAN
jgi:hypothetical protein